MADPVCISTPSVPRHSGRPLGGTTDTRQLMNAELDHVFICASCGGEEASVLTAFGLSEGTPNVHPGQGTACRRFFFCNGYLELLWVSDATEAQSQTTQPTHLWERWIGRGDGACPFGLGFRPNRQGVAGTPFPAWEYRPQYLPASWSFQIATNAAVLGGPMLFYLPFSQRPDAHPTRQVLEHTAGLREITRIEVLSPHTGTLSPAFAAALRADGIRVRSDVGYLLEIGFDGELAGKTADFRPSLPVVFHW